MRHRRLILPLVILLCGAILSGAAWRYWARVTNKRAPSQRARKVHVVSLAGMTMGGSWSVKLDRLPAGGAREQLQAGVAAILEQVDARMSVWKTDSSVWRFNHFHADQWFLVPRDVAEVVGDAQRISRLTGGAFDVTVAPLVNLWGFGPIGATMHPQRIPSDDEIAATRAHVGYGRLESRLSPPALHKSDPLLAIDLGGIAKGYAADAVGAYLDRRGATDYLIAVGGELRAKGRVRRVGIETPTPDIRRVLLTLDLHNASLSTSGDYRNFITINGKRFCHEIDPRTGRAVQASLASVSVVHLHGASADALATGLFVLGPDRGYALASQLNLAALFVIRGEGRFETRQTPAFAAIAQLTPRAAIP